MASTENVIENDEPLDISKATVEQISENKFIDVKITSTVCQLNKEKTLFDFDNDEYYYLIPMKDGKFIVFVTENIKQNKELEDFIDKYNKQKKKYNRIEEALNLDINCRVYDLTEYEEEKFFNYAIKANFGINSIQEAKQCIVPYKIVNNVTCLSWVYILTAIVSLITAIFITILLVRKLKANENYINVMPNNSCSLSENTHNSYSNDEYYTDYNQQDDVDSQANNNQNDIHRF